MSAASLYFRELSTEGGAAWNRFWFAPAAPQPLGVLRIATGIITLGYVLSWMSHLPALFAADGLLPPDMVSNLLEQQNRHLYRFSPLFQLETPLALYVFHAVAITTTCLLIAGVYSRVSAAATLLMLLSYVHRAPLLTGPLETVLAMLLLYLVVGPSGAFYSVDAWLAKLRDKSRVAPSWLANVSLRLMQVHLALFLFLVASSTLASPAWWNGSAIWVIESQELSRPIDLSALRSFPKVVNLWTHLFVFVNLLFPFLVWYRLLRPLVVASTAVMWLLMIPISGQLLYVAAILVAMYSFATPPRNVK